MNRDGPIISLVRFSFLLAPARPVITKLAFNEKTKDAGGGPGDGRRSRAG